jgi:putative addiction module killer protein
MLSLRRYQTEDGKVPVTAWLANLKNAKTRSVIEDRLDRVKSGLLGTNDPCRDGVYELKIDFGPGFRVYYAKIGKTVLLLLCGGDKSSQNRDIEKAVKYLKDFERRVK